MQSKKQAVEEVRKNFDNFKELIDSEGNIYLDLLVDKANLRKCLIGKTIKLTLSQDKKDKEIEKKLEDTEFILLSSLGERFKNEQLMVLNNTTKINNPAVYKDLLFMTLNIVSHTCNTYKQKLLEGGFNDWQKEINTITFFMQILTVLLNVFNQKRSLTFEAKTNYAVDESKVVETMLDCFNDLENRIITNDKEISSLYKELENAKRDLEFIILCQERGLARPGDDKLFTENIEVTLYTKELETLRKSFVEMECINTTLEQKIVHLLNDKNSLMSKNALLEDHILSKKKIVQKKSNFQERINNSKQTKGYLMTSKLAKNDLMSQIKEQAEIINNMALHNTQLNAFIEKLKKDNKICTQTHILFRRVITEKEIQYLKLDHSLKNFKILNSQLESDLNDKDKVIETLEMQLKQSLRKIDELCIQLNTSEAIRVGQEAELTRIAQVVADISTGGGGVHSVYALTPCVTASLGDLGFSEDDSLTEIIIRKSEHNKKVFHSSKFNDKSEDDDLQCKNILNLDPVITEIENSTIISASENIIPPTICDTQNENQVKFRN